jgi:hypothetical protein
LAIPDSSFLRFREEMIGSCKVFKQQIFLPVYGKLIPDALLNKFIKFHVPARPFYLSVVFSGFVSGFFGFLEFRSQNTPSS